MRKLYSYGLDCGRMGYIEGLFIADEADVEAAYGKRAEFGEALGKNSDVSDDLDESSFTIKSEDPEFVAKLEELLGSSISGYNPLDYLNEDEEYEEVAENQ